jgi:hypothetical protein
MENVGKGLLDLIPCKLTAYCQTVFYATQITKPMTLTPQQDCDK